MPPKKLSLLTTQQHQNRRLDHVLAEWLPQALNQPVSKGKVRKLIVAGAVYLNGKRVRIASKELMPRAEIDVFVDLARLNADERAQDKPFVMTPHRVLFEDEYLIIVDKPPGLPTQPTVDEARDNLFASVKKFLSERERRSLPEIYLGLHHRLDRDTSGVILFTKSKDANPGIAALFTSHSMEKTYQALTDLNRNEVVQAGWTIKNYLGRSKTGGKKAKFCAVKSGGDFAQTDFRLLQQMKTGLWVEAKPRTGRTHQIRVHLSEMGLPILGDQTYGSSLHSEKMKIPRLMLHAVNLTFKHPISQNVVSVQSSLPGDFSQCLANMRKGGCSSS